MSSPNSRWGGFDCQPGAASAQIPEVRVQTRMVGAALRVGAATLGITSRAVYFKHTDGETQERLRATHPQNQDALLVDRCGIYVADGVSTSRDGANASQLVIEEFSSHIGYHDPTQQSPEAVVQMAHDAAGYAQKELRKSADGGATTLTALIATNDPNKFVRWTTGDSRSIHGRNGVLLSAAPIQSLVDQRNRNGQPKACVTNTFAAHESILRSNGRPKAKHVPREFKDRAGLFVDHAEIIEVAPGDTVALYTDGLEALTAEQRAAHQTMDPTIVLQYEMLYPTPEMAARQALTLPERMCVFSRHYGGPEILPALDDITLAIGRMGVLGQ